jgi:hypothetical protein
MHTCGTVLRTSSTRILNYSDSVGDWNRWKFSTFTCRATTHSYAASYNTATETTFTISVVRDSRNVPSDRFNVQFRLRHGAPTLGIIHNNLAGDVHYLLFSHVRPANQSTKTGVDLCHKKVGRRWFTETRVIRYKQFIS